MPIDKCSLLPRDLAGSSGREHAHKHANTVLPLGTLSPAGTRQSSGSTGPHLYPRALGGGVGGDLPLWPGPSVCLLHSKEPAALGIGPQSALAVLRSHRPPRESRVHMVLGAQGSGLDQIAALTSSRGRRPLRAPLGGLYWVLDLLTLKAEGGRGTWATSDLCLLCWDLRTACLERGGGRGWGAGQLAQSPRRGA